MRSVPTLGFYQLACSAPHALLEYLLAEAAGRLLKDDASPPNGEVAERLKALAC
jgi:hypothetical protein